MPSTAEAIKAAAPPAQWQSPLPHQASLENLNLFWHSYQDTLLVTLINAAEIESVDLSSARTRIMQARTNRVTANATLLPTLDVTGSTSYAVDQPITTYSDDRELIFNPSRYKSPTFTAQTGLQASWELDIFGKNVAALEAKNIELLNANTGWHLARVSLAAEVATSYFNYRFCNEQLNIIKANADSLNKSARITDIAVKAGFNDSSYSYLAHATEANAQEQLKLQRATCALMLKELVALTNYSEPMLLAKFAEAPKLENSTNNKQFFSISEIPAETIAQRPDIYMAEQDIKSAAAELQNVNMQALPSIFINGSIGLLRQTGKGYVTQGPIWSLGPISFTLPIFDGGRRKANAQLAKVHLEETFSNYRNKVRIAVKEVEQALVNLNSTEQRLLDLQKASIAYQSALRNAELKYKSGFINALALEDAQRAKLQTDSAITALNKAHNDAWISLYRAAGGGWNQVDSLSKTISTSNQGEISNALLIESTKDVK